MRLTHVVRAGVAAAAAVTAALVFPAMASAHVTVNPNTAVQGGYTKVTFRVPTERDDASTTKLEVAIPTDKPIVSVGLKPVQGWTAATETTKLATPIKSGEGDEITEAVSKITWTATDPNAAIKPHQFQEFDVSLGPLPQTDQIVFKALQTYSSGEVVRWIDEPSAGGEAEHPAPVLKLTKKSDTAASAPATAPTVAAGSSSSSSSGNGTAIGLSIAGLVLGLAGLVVGFLAYRRAGTPAA
ncbi:YcnI family protein [Dactylosporangium sp. CA-139066]|uniref:YcnI family protein n=1 Tax=Dactylosporangium sp. CA-139066 TaxID=3239930 RepID=UPI003D924325